MALSNGGKKPEVPHLQTQAKELDKLKQQKAEWDKEMRSLRTEMEIVRKELRDLAEKVQSLQPKHPVPEVSQ